MSHFHVSVHGIPYKKSSCVVVAQYMIYREKGYDAAEIGPQPVHEGSIPLSSGRMNLWVKDIPQKYCLTVVAVGNFERAADQFANGSMATFSLLHCILQHISSPRCLAVLPIRRVLH